MSTRFAWMGFVWSALIVVQFGSCLAQGPNNPLPSWNDNPTKESVVTFVGEVIDENGDNYVPPEERIATFDNDGTLWCEKPLYIHLFANLDRFAELIDDDPSLASTQPYHAISTQDMGYFVGLYEQGKIDEVVADLFAVPFDGMSTSQFDAWNRNWLADWKHPRFEVGYRGLIYQPMVELVQFLQENEFEVYIFTADEGAFLQLVAHELYGVAAANVHGSSVQLEYKADDGEATLLRTDQAQYFDNWDAKPRLIRRALGRRPILAAGNSNGDLHMLQYVSQQERNSLSLLVHHSDGDREYQYDAHTDKVLPLAEQEGWTVIDMRADWSTVFPNDASD